MHQFFAVLALLLADKPAPADSAAPTPNAKPAAPAPDASKPDAPAAGKTNAESGEARRNENVQFNQIDNNAKREQTQRMGTTATLITEMKPDRTFFGSEYGEAGSGAIHVAAQKPASSLHGSVFLTHGNSALTARSFFQVGGVRPARDNQYGFNLGAKLWRNSFFSVDASQQRTSGYVNGNILIPLDSERTPRTSNVEHAKLIQRFLNAYPRATPNRPDIDQRALNTNARQDVVNETFTLQLDQKITSKDRLTARHTFAGQRLDAFQFVAGQNPLTTLKNHAARLSWTRSFDPRTQLDATVGFDRNKTQLDVEPNAVGPQVQIGTAFERLGPANNIPMNRLLNRFRYSAMLSRRQGSHSLAFGGEVIRNQFNSAEVSSQRGNYFFRADLSRDGTRQNNPIQNFLEGNPTRYSAALGDPKRYHRGTDQSFFAGDNWRVTSKLQLSYGVRYNPVSGLYEKSGLDVYNFNCDCNNVGPRFGFAYQLPGKAGVIRSAWGLHYGEIFASTLQQNRFNPPNTVKFEVLRPADFLNPAAGVTLSPTTRAIIATYGPNLQSPYSNNYTFTWEASLPGAWRVQTGYVGSRTRKIFILWHNNRARVVPGVAQNNDTIQQRRPDQRYFDYRTVENGANAYFDAGRASLIAPSWRGLTFDGSYWFSKAIETGASYLNTAAGDDARQGYSQTEFGVASDLKAVAVFDQKHAFIARLNYAGPKLRTRGRWAALAGSWNFNGVFLAKSGMPFTVITGSDSPGSGNVDGANGDRPNILKPEILGMAINRPDLRLPRDAFGLIRPTDPSGNIGVNTFRRGGIRNMNASLGRTWTIAGEKKIGFRAESINFFNTPQFAEPNPDLSSPAFGKITNTLNDGRVFRFQLRLSF